ncbi:hypothetical protein Hanom_Chr00s015991g01755461 [Helianthus anomalus]
MGPLPSYYNSYLFNFLSLKYHQTDLGLGLGLHPVFIIRVEFSTLSLSRNSTQVLIFNTLPTGFSSLNQERKQSNLPIDYFNKIFGGFLYNWGFLFVSRK